MPCDKSFRIVSPFNLFEASFWPPGLTVLPFQARACPAHERRVTPMGGRAPAEDLRKRASIVIRFPVESSVLAPFP